MKPDILILMIEEPEGLQKQDVPVMAGLLARMLYVKEYFSVSPLPEPAFASFLTGRYPRALEWEQGSINTEKLEKLEKTWVKDFADCGYQTKFFNLNSDYSDRNNIIYCNQQPCLHIARLRVWNVDLDTWLDRWIQEKKDKDSWDNQVIVIAGGGSETDIEEGILFRDEMIHVPLWIKPVADWETAVSDLTGAVESVDIGATLAEAVGIGLSYRQSGISFFQGMKGKARGREWVVSEFMGYTMVCTRECKAVYDSDGRVFQLFDRIRDPKELVNLAGQDGTRQLEQTMSFFLANLDDE